MIPPRFRKVARSPSIIVPCLLVRAQPHQHPRRPHPPLFGSVVEGSAAVSRVAPVDPRTFPQQILHLFDVSLARCRAKCLISRPCVIPSHRVVPVPPQAAVGDRSAQERRPEADDAQEHEERYRQQDHVDLEKQREVPEGVIVEQPAVFADAPPEHHTPHSHCQVDQRRDRLEPRHARESSDNRRDAPEDRNDDHNRETERPDVECRPALGC
mmetsp:Transcript_9250/g.21743  ORF Transcript_9250/g.21743 Transcript_9250/m.21743 type:complete len:212 (-) Transcript_9250:264-899(-)